MPAKKKSWRNRKKLETVAVSPCIYSPKPGTGTNWGKKWSNMEGLKSRQILKKRSGNLFTHAFKGKMNGKKLESLHKHGWHGYRHLIGFWQLLPFISYSCKNLKRKMFGFPVSQWLPLELVLFILPWGSDASFSPALYSGVIEITGIGLWTFT